MARIHVLGASGSGTSTLGAALADALAVPNLDTDDFYWLPTDPPFTSRRPKEERISMLMDKIASETGWVLSGSAIGWAQPLEPLYDLIVYVWLDPASEWLDYGSASKGVTVSALKEAAILKEHMQSSSLGRPNTIQPGWNSVAAQHTRHGLRHKKLRSFGSTHLDL